MMNAYPRAFEIIFSNTQAGRFSGRRTFIEDLEKACPDFYNNIGQHLKAWRAAPPKPVVLKCETETDRELISSDRVIQGNKHTALLEVPSFLNRLGAGQRMKFE